MDTRATPTPTKVWDLIYNFGSAVRGTDCRNVALGYSLSPFRHVTPTTDADTYDSDTMRAHTHACSELTHVPSAGRHESLARGYELNFTAREQTSTLSDVLDAADIFLSTN